LVAINDVLSLKAARRDAIANLESFGVSGHPGLNVDGFICIRLRKVSKNRALFFVDHPV